MINCEIKKTYLINLIIGIIFSIVALVFTIVLIVLKVYAAFIVAGYFVIRYFRYKKQYLKFDSNGFEGKVVAVKGSKPTLIKGNLSFILSASTKGSV